MTLSSSGIGSFGVQSNMDPVDYVVSIYSLILGNLVIVNGKSRAQFTPSRELWQSDPFSPYLFLICDEGFISLINNAERKGDLKGLAVTRRGTSINHLLFVNDNILFCGVTKEE